MNGYIRMEIQAQSAGGDGASPPSDHVCPRTLTAPSLLQHFFTSFGARDRCFLLIFRLWQNALLEKVGLGESGLGIEVGGILEPGDPNWGSWRAPSLSFMGTGLPCLQLPA